MMCESKMITKSDDVDVGCGNAFGSGGEEDGGVDSTVQQVNNVIDGFQLTETQIGTAADFKSWIKEYMNLVVNKLKENKAGPEAVQGFKAQAPGIAKFFLVRRIPRLAWAWRDRHMPALSSHPLSPPSPRNSKTSLTCNSTSAPPSAPTPWSSPSTPTARSRPTSTSSWAASRPRSFKYCLPYPPPAALPTNRPLSLLSCYVLPVT